MENRNGVKWSREETILAFDLYCRTPFGKISQSNPDIKELAELLGRTPGSVALKMHNLAHYDPELQQRNITAMAHGSKLDKEIYDEFSSHWTELTYQAQVLRAKLQNVEVEEVVDIGEVALLPPGEYREQMMKTRVGQYFFRASVLNWLCLNSLHDKAFDRGLITITPDYQLLVSDVIKKVEMDERTREWFMGYDRKKIHLPDKFLPGKHFSEYHNDVIFQR